MQGKSSVELSLHANLLRMIWEARPVRRRLAEDLISQLKHAWSVHSINA